MGKETMIQPIQMTIFQSNTFQTDLDWPHVEAEPKEKATYPIKNN